MRRSAVPLFLALLAPLPLRAQTSAPPPVPAVPPPSNANAPTSAAPRSGMSAFTPAPVPGIVPEQVAPADRVAGAEPGGQARDSGPTNSTPLSGTPSTIGPGGGSVSGAQSRDGVPSTGLSTPNLSR